ncbi:MAG: hypothetical protein LUG95_01310 [Clostridiales bacterium]|nr:hypothetical protein [Clostridiales bacterium]
MTNASGYTIQYATNKKFTKNKKTVTVKKGKTTSATLKKTQKGQDILCQNQSLPDSER